jgi:hypothetical protein
MHAQPAVSNLTYAPVGTAAATAIGVAIAILVWAAISNIAFPVIGSLTVLARASMIQKPVGSLSCGADPVNVDSMRLGLALRPKAVRCRQLGCQPRQNENLSGRCHPRQQRRRQL